jgi:hypothetical protein
MPGGGARASVIFTRGETLREATGPCEGTKSSDFELKGLVMHTNAHPNYVPYSQDILFLQNII